MLSKMNGSNEKERLFVLRKYQDYKNYFQILLMRECVCVCVAYGGLFDLRLKKEKQIQSE